MKRLFALLGLILLSSGGLEFIYWTQNGRAAGICMFASGLIVLAVAIWYAGETRRPRPNPKTGDSGDVFGGLKRKVEFSKLRRESGRQADYVGRITPGAGDGPWQTIEG